MIKNVIVRRASDEKVRVSRVGDTVVVSAPVAPLPPELSASERDVVARLLAGQSNGEIGQARGTSAKTVANQLHAIYRKLGVNSRDELAARLALGE